MKRLSFWAKHHVFESRIFIVLIWISLNILGYFSGRLFNDLAIEIPVYYLQVSTCIVFVVAMLYPRKRHSSKKSFLQSYNFRKALDFAVASATFIMILYLGNQKDITVSGVQSIYAMEFPSYPNKLQRGNDSVFQNYYAKLIATKSYSKKERNNYVKQQLHSIKKDKDLTKTQKKLLIALCIILATGLILGLAALSCSLSCSGMEGLAVLVGLGGTALVILLLFHLIKKIKSARNPKEE